MKHKRSSCKFTWLCISACSLILCLFIVGVEISTLQNSVEHAKKQSINFRKVVTNKNSNKTIMILIANYRDTERCAETVAGLFSNSMYPDLLRIGIHDQIYTAQGEITCMEQYQRNYCNDDSCRVNQIRYSVIDANEAKGPTVARYHTEELIEDEDFCMSIDSHLIFIKNWDQELLRQFNQIGNPNAIITVYPKSTEFIGRTDVTDVQLMCLAQIESDSSDAMVRYGIPEFIKPPEKPQLMSQLAGGFNFGSCHQALEVRNDPYTPFLFHGEEYSRAARLWTNGYDMYVPTMDIAYHWYESRKVIWERNWEERYLIQQKSQRRVRHMLGLTTSQNDVDLTNIHQFSLGTKRTLKQWIEFSSIDPSAPFDPNSTASGENPQFNNCKELTYVPYN